ncbi:glycolate oxidase subunit GlcF [Methylovirgula sp. 4M-Z18]|uniref:glycolate oxidase subunit GlcF n=1 Tax=Methylovirgula sp. 4M-Z18 TaxID=2293567 RepID=UPI000E2FCA76|nr:glycolate oxidase subunit GlcF [Methylovirgula sp. 4M-Z18]RFB79702.1 glycolate oxidase iron-sulfur subunit [Methylovirgula sp. 4M-Z18]
MQTNFTAQQLADPHMRESEKILRSCVHCGFCTATCPTYLLLGDELDSPRGRIYLMKDMLENGRPATREVVTHIDRCLSCLSCMTTCPSGVHYMHLVDHARAHIERTYRRPWQERLLRGLLAQILPYPNRFRLALLGAAVARPFRPLVAKIPNVGARLEAMLDLAPPSPPVRAARHEPQTLPVARVKRRVAILSGCAQEVLSPETNAAALRLLDRLGVEVVVPRGEGCCGALTHHLGREAAALAFVKRNVDAWMREIEGQGLDAILITASGCGTMVKDYGFLLRDDPAYAQKAPRVAALAQDITEFLGALSPMGEMMRRAPLPLERRAQNLTLAYHSACSMQHGQKITDLPKQLLQAAGFRVKDVPEGHICCGSAGTYNILQPEIARQLGQRKAKNILRQKPDAIAAGNIGCITQIGRAMQEGEAQVPIVHTVELLDWAYGGPEPKGLRRSTV